MAGLRTDSDLRTRAAPGSGVRRDLSGIGGWLLLVAIALLFAPLADAGRIYSDLSTLYGSGFGQLMSDHPGATQLMVSQIVADSIFLICLVALNYLFYRKNKKFPRMMIVFLCVHGLYILFRSHASDVLLGTHGFAASAASVAASASIWISYLASSKRVKATFVD
jgi:preprotein translocase subunit SecG